MLPLATKGVKYEGVGLMEESRDQEAGEPESSKTGDFRLRLTSTP